MTKIVIISFSLKKGGAALAASNFKYILNDLGKQIDIKSITQDDAGFFQLIKRLISFGLSKLQIDSNPTKHSLNLFSYTPVIKSFKNEIGAIHHLHWINNDTLSIFDFEKIPAGTIISLHDEWLYCGSEHHYKMSDNFNQFIDNYKFFKKGILGIHWNYLIWRIKLYKLINRKDIIFLVPSSWMLERAKSSVMLRGLDIRLLPNPIDTDIFCPTDKKTNQQTRSELKIEHNSFVFLYENYSIKNNRLKGIDKLHAAFDLLRQKNINISLSKVVLVNFGKNKGESSISGFRNISLGYVNDKKSLAKIYSMADCTMVPSLVESFGQVASESISCGTPVICFGTSGLKDIVKDKISGLVAKPFSEVSLCEKIQEIIKTPNKERTKIAEQGRAHIVNNFSNSVINKKYKNILKDAEDLK